MTKRQKLLAKKFYRSRAKQKAQRARFAEIRKELQAAYAKFLSASSELSDYKLKREKRRLVLLTNRVLTKAKGI